MTKFLFIFIALSFSLEAMSAEPQAAGNTKDWDRSCVEGSLSRGSLHHLLVAENGMAGCAPVQFRASDDDCVVLRDFLISLSTAVPEDEHVRLTQNYVKLCQ